MEQEREKADGVSVERKPPISPGGRLESKDVLEGMRSLQ
jgi:hypothetical protein